MKWSETVASKCRWAEAAAINWGEWDVLWEDSVDDYQGHASFLATKGGKYVFYEWWYGSCSGCDPWEGEYDYEREQLAKHMNERAAYFKNKTELKKWLDMLEGEAPIGDREAGGLCGSLDLLSGGLRTRIDAMREHLKMPPMDWEAWAKRQEEKKETKGKE